MLKSYSMALSDAERTWLPFGGKTGKLAMRWATRRNRLRYAWLETAFEGIAQTRVKLLSDWAEQQWAHLEGFARALPTEGMASAEWLAARLRISPDCTELFLIDPQGRVLASSEATSVGQTTVVERARTRVRPPAAPVVRTLPRSEDAGDRAAFVAFP